MTGGERKRYGNSLGGSRKVKKGFATVDPARLRDIARRGVQAKRMRAKMATIRDPKGTHNDSKKTA